MLRVHPAEPQAPGLSHRIPQPQLLPPGPLQPVATCEVPTLSLGLQLL